MTMHIQRNAHVCYCGKWTGSTPARMPLADYQRTKTPPGKMVWCEQCVRGLEREEGEK